MTTQRWFEIVLHVAPPDVDAASGVLALSGVSGCEVVDGEGSCCEMRVHVLADDAEAAAVRAAELRARLGTLLATREGMSRPDAAVLANAKAPPAAEHDVRELDERVWREDWKRHFARTRIGRRVEIVPPWDAAPTQDAAPPGVAGAELRDGAADVVSIVINPGMAFGTGRHETTAGCLELLEEYVRNGDRVLDLGCGSGILAIAAVKLGASKALAIDNDPEAVNAAHENVVLNAVSDRVEIRFGDVPCETGGGGCATFDIAVANILAEPLAQLAPTLTSCVTDDGALVLSGIESQRRALVEIAYGKLGWRVSRTIERSGWVSLALAKQGTAGGRGL